MIVINKIVSLFQYKIQTSSDIKIKEISFKTASQHRISMLTAQTLPVETEYSKHRRQIEVSHAGIIWRHLHNGDQQIFVLLTAKASQKN